MNIGQAAQTIADLSIDLHKSWNAEANLIKLPV